MAELLLCWLQRKSGSDRERRGSGYSETSFGRVDWKAWDLFVLPGTKQAITHHAHEGSTEEGGAALFWWNDEPLLKYLGAGPITPTFQPKFFSKEVISSHTSPSG